MVHYRPFGQTPAELAEERRLRKLSEQLRKHKQTCEKNRAKRKRKKK